MAFVSRLENGRTHAVEENANQDIVALGALLHDIADWKFHDGDEDAGPREARSILEQAGADPNVIEAVCDIVATISFKGAGVPDTMRTLEGKIVQDADRLDALGAIGIARVFAYGGSRNRPLYDPDIRPELHATKEAYKQSQGTSVNHFYEKLLLLRDRLHTATAKRIADERHTYMEDYLDRFYVEWEGKK